MDTPTTISSPQRSRRASSFTVLGDDFPPRPPTPTQPSKTRLSNDTTDNMARRTSQIPQNDLSITASPRSDIESQKTKRSRPSHWSLVTDQAHLTPAVAAHPYRGSGTHDDPFVVEWIPNDGRNPMGFPMWKKWMITVTVAFATLAVSLVSSAYSGGVKQIAEEFHASNEVLILGISLFVLGFAIGPLFWAPLSEMYGRQIVFTFTYTMLTIWNAAAAGAPNMKALLIFRFLGGAFGSSPLTNAGGVVADIFPAAQRGLAMSVFAAAPFLGPCLGPITGGFLGEAAGWRWVEGYLAIFSGTLCIIASLVVPETYAPVILRKRAKLLSSQTGQVYKTGMDIRNGDKSLGKELKTALSRPWIFLLLEPIVLVISIFMAIIYGTLFLCFAGFPIVYQQGRGWSEGVGGLAFLGILVGMVIAVGYTIYDNGRYKRTSDAHDGNAPPEARLPTAMIGCVALPIGLFWFAWTNGPTVHWSVSIVGTTPFGFGMVLVFLSLINYLIDAYTVYAASVLAASSVLRSLFGAAFPLFTTQMYDALGVHWASSIPAFLALICVPAPFLFYKYGEAIRLRCKYAAESAEFMKMMRERESDHEEEEHSAEKSEAPRSEDRGGVVAGSLID